MAVVNFNQERVVYVILGINVYENDQVLGVCSTYEDAKRYCIESLVETEFFDIWIEKHPVF